MLIILSFPFLIIDNFSLFNSEMNIEFKIGFLYIQIIRGRKSDKISSCSVIHSLIFNRNWLECGKNRKDEERYTCKS